MNPEDRLTEILRTDAGSHQPGDGRGGIARRLAARRRARRLRNAAVPLTMAVVATVVALLVLPSGPARQKVDAANRPGTTAAGPGPRPTVTTTPPTTSARSVSPSTTTAGGGSSPTTVVAPTRGARLPAGYTQGDATEANGSVYVTGTSPGAQNSGAGSAVVLRYPISGPPAAGATSAPMPGPLAYSLGSGALWVLTGAQPYANSTGPSNLVALDPSTLAERGSYSLVGPAASVDAAGGFVWVGLSSGGVERINPTQASSVASFPAPGSGTSAAVSVSLSPDGNLLYEMLQQPLEVLERNATTGKVLHTASLAGPGGDSVIATGYGVWAHFATGMADSVEGFTAADLSSYASEGGTNFGEGSERLGDAVVGPTDSTGRLYVWGYQRGGCYDSKSGSFIAAFALPQAISNAPVAAGPDGVFQVGSQGSQKVTMPATCTAG